MMSKLAAPLLILLTLADNLTAAETDVADAVVRIGGCSGVCVDPAGYVLTAKHCRLGETETVHFPDQAVTARRVYAAPETEGPVVYDCDGEGFPWIGVGEAVPPPGSAVSALGYPAADGERTLARAAGRIVRGGQFEYQGGPFLGNVTDFATGPGWSGGPLLDADGQVVGLVNGGDGETTIFISFGATRAAYDAVRMAPAVRPPLYVFTTVACASCAHFKRDYAADVAFRRALDAQYDVQVHDATGREALAQQYGVSEFPAFVVPGRPPLIGYSGPSDLLARLRGERTPTQPEPPAEVDWSDVTIVMLVARQDVAASRGTVRGTALGLAAGPIERRVADLTDGKAALEVVAERREPERYRAVMQAARIEVESLFGNRSRVEYPCFQGFFASRESV